MAQASPFEQYLLEQINHARLAPQQNFDRYITGYDPLTSSDPDVQSAINGFGVSGSVLEAQVAALTPVAPLAWNSALNQAATLHSQDMIANGVQAHVIGESTPLTRFEDVGYDYSALGENIFAYAKSALYAHAGFMIDWGNTATGIQTGAGHRVNIMNPAFREVGIGVVEGVSGPNGLGPNVVTEDFGNSPYLAETILLGVARVETDGDGFYSIGEGSGGVSVRIAGGDGTTTEAAGGYRLDTSAGNRTVTFSGGDLARDIAVTAHLEAGNAKLDLVNGWLLETSVDLTLGSGARNAAFIGNNGTDLTGNDERNRLTGNGLANELSGEDGNDVLIGRAGGDRLTGGSGADLLKGGAGSDVLIGRTGSDKLVGGAGNDLLKGQMGDDLFVFHDSFGRDTIADLDPGDTIRITTTGEADTVGELRDALRDSAEGAVYDHLGDGENVIVFRGITVAEMDLGQFDL